MPLKQLFKTICNRMNMLASVSSYLRFNLRPASAVGETYSSVIN